MANGQCGIMGYVIRNRLPRFPLGMAESDARHEAMRAELDKAVQAWLRERIISDLERRRVSTALHEFAVWLENREGASLESVTFALFSQWRAEQKVGPQINIDDFLKYLRARLPALDWKPME